MEYNNHWRRCREKEEIISYLAYDARFITSRPTGIGQVCRSLLKALAASPDCPPLLVLVNREISLPPEVRNSDRFEFVNAPLDPTGVANQVWLPFLLRGRGVRALHSLDCFAPVAAVGVRHVINVHDLIPITCADRLRRSKKVKVLPVWRAWLRLQCARAAVVVTGSRHSAGDISRLLGAPPEKIRVIYDPIRQWKETEPVEVFRDRLRLRGRVISYAGRHDPYKNLVGLVRALPEVIGNLSEPVSLVIAGEPDPRYPEAMMEVERLGLRDRVVFAGYLAEPALGALYRASDAFVFPSYYEGFGIPPLEAMSLGAPVVASNRTSLPEVLGDAALYVDPDDPADIARGVLQVLCDPGVGARLREKGLVQAARFSAERAAAAYLELYRNFTT